MSAPVSVSPTSAHTKICRQQLDLLLLNTAGIESAAVVTGDGFEIASVLHESISGNKLAAMASSLLALSEAVVEELRMGGCRNVIIEAEVGTLVMIRIPTSGIDLLMSVLCRSDAVLGSVLYATRVHATQLGDHLKKTS